MRLWIGFPLVLLVYGAWGSSIQVLRASSRAPQEQAPVFRVEANLVLLRFHVRRNGSFAGDIRQDQIRILEDGKPQEVVLFDAPQSRWRLVPVEMILLLDVSMSVMNWGLLNGEMLEATVLSALDGNASISIWAFANRLKRFCPPTRDPSALNRALEDAYRFQHLGTRLYEAIEGTCGKVSEAGPAGLRALIVFSDGFATNKQANDDAANTANASDVKIYPVVLGHARVRQRAGARGPAGAGDHYWQERQMERFADLGELTGGRSFDPPAINARTIKAILENVAAEVRDEYVAGYHSSSAPGRHKARVILTEKSLGKIRGGEKEYRR